MFLSYASQDAAAAQRICEALRPAGIEVWFDKSELRGGDVWDQKIRREIRDCALFIPVISANTASRHEGYFRLEWDLADQRTHMMARDRAFIVPVCLDATPGTDVPESFHRFQWTRLPGGETPPAFVERVRRLLSPEASPARTAGTPGSFSSTQTQSPKTSVPAPWRSIPLWTIAAVALAYFFVDKFWISRSLPAASPPVGATEEAASRTTIAPALVQPVKPVEATIPEKSVAVLPFVDMSEKHDQEYLADGLAEQLIDLFAKIPDLRVPARTSSFHFKGMSEDMPTIARQLRVAHVLKGSVRRTGNRLRVTAQLIRASDGYHVWSETYDREVRDVFKIQDDIASTIVNTLKATLIPLGGTATPSFDAYMAFLIGRQHFDRDTLDGYRSAAKSFRRSIEFDPNLGAAYSELSLADMMAAFYSRETPDVATVISDADRGAALAPQNGRSYTARGLIRFWLRFDWRGAEADFTKALELAPGDAAVHRRYAVLLDDLGRHADALTESERATDLDPLLPLSWEIHGEELITAGRWQDARRALERALELNSTSLRARQDLAVIDLMEGNPDRALAAFRQMRDEGAPVEEWQWGIVVAEHSLGHEQASRVALDDYVHRFGSSRPYAVAEIYASCGQTDEALRWLERAYARRPADLIEIKSSWGFSGLSADPRFKAILRKMNLPE